MAFRIAVPPATTLQQALQTYLLVAYGIFLAGFFLTINAVDHYKFLLGLLLVPALPILPRILAGLKRDPVVQLAALYLFYLLSSALWGDGDNAAELARHAALAGLIMFFVALTAFLSATQPGRFGIIVFGAIAVATANALLSIALWEQLPHFGNARLIGLGTLREPNSAGAVYGFYALLAIAWQQRMASRRARIVLFCAGFVLLAFLLFSQARAAIVATVAALTLLAACNPGHRPRVHVLALTIVVGAALLISGAGNESLLRSHSWQVRLDLWIDSLRYIADAPLFGNGYLSALELYSQTENKSHTNVHSSYLAALRDGGLLGLALLAAFLGAALQRAVRIGRASGDYALLALLSFGLIYMLTSTDTLITRPRELWAVLWFPVGLLAGLHLRHGIELAAARGPARID